MGEVSFCNRIWELSGRKWQRGNSTPLSNLDEPGRAAKKAFLQTCPNKYSANIYPYIDTFIVLCVRYKAQPVAVLNIGYRTGQLIKTQFYFILC